MACTLSALLLLICIELKRALAPICRSKEYLKVSTAVETEKKPAKKRLSKKLLIIMAVVVVLLLFAGAGVAYVVSQRHAVDENGDDVEAVAKEPAPAPTFLPIDTMVVNLADPGGERFAQVGITLELADAKTAELIKQFMPSIRSSVLLLISQKTSDELLSREGKDKLAHDILREVSRPLGFSVPDAPVGVTAAKPTAGHRAENKSKDKGKAGGQENPVHRVLFSGFIIQ